MTKSKPYKSLRLRQLRAFCACARHESYTAAARSLGVSQPVVWEQVRALERSFGVTLLLRRGRVLVLTEDGAAFLELAGQLVAGMDSLEDRFAERRAGLMRRLTVAGAASLMIEDLAETTARFAKSRADVIVSVQAEQNYRVVELVANGEADVGVVQFGRLESLPASVTSEPLFDRPWSLFAPKRHPLLTKKVLSLEDLVGSPLILEAPGLPWRTLVDEEFRRAGLGDRVRVAAEVTNVLAARRFVGLGMGVTILPRPARGIALPGVGARLIDNLFAPEHVVLLWRTGATPKPSAREYADLIKTRLAGRSPTRR